MPGRLRTEAIGATAHEVDELKQRISDLDQKLHAIASALERRPNPVQSNQDSFVMQLLLAEKDRNERISEKLAEYQNPLHQLDQLQTLSALLPQQDDGGSKMLEEVLQTVGGLVAAKMAQGQTPEGDSEPDRDHAVDDDEER